MASRSRFVGDERSRRATYSGPAIFAERTEARRDFGGFEIDEEARLEWWKQPW